MEAKESSKAIEPIEVIGLMNPDKLFSDQSCASTSNRNFIGRQGSPNGRTFLVSPVMAAAAAVEGALVDVREL